MDPLGKEEAAFEAGGTDAGFGFTAGMVGGAAFFVGAAVWLGGVSVKGAAFGTVDGERSEQGGQ